MSLWFYGRARSHAATAASAPITEVALPVDGESTTFAVARRDDATITITGHGGPAGLVLQTLTPASL